MNGCGQGAPEKPSASLPHTLKLNNKGLTLKTELTVERLRELLHYNPETGVFTWKLKRPGRCGAGKEAGCFDAAHSGIKISVDGKQYKANRLAWFYVNGTWPKDQLSYINGCSVDNRIGNLRECDMQNRKARNDNSSGFVGAVWNKKNQRWQAQIKIDGRNKHLGNFTDPRSASDAYAKAKEALLKQKARSTAITLPGAPSPMPRAL